MPKKKPATLRDTLTSQPTCRLTSITPGLVKSKEETSVAPTLLQTFRLSDTFKDTLSWGKSLDLKVKNLFRMRRSIGTPMDLKALPSCKIQLIIQKKMLTNVVTTEIIANAGEEFILDSSIEKTATPARSTL